MNSHYLCQKNLTLLSIYPDLTEQFLYCLIDEGNLAVKSQNFQHAIDCFKAAFEASKIILEQNIVPDEQLETTSEIRQTLHHLIQPAETLS